MVVSATLRRHVQVDETNTSSAENIREPCRSGGARHRADHDRSLDSADEGSPTIVEIGTRRDLRAYGAIEASLRSTTPRLTLELATLMQDCAASLPNTRAWSGKARGLGRFALRDSAIASPRRAHRCPQNGSSSSTFVDLPVMVITAAR